MLGLPLRDSEGLSHEEIAEVLPCDPEAEVHHSQACAQLVAALTPLPERQEACYSR